MRKKFITLFLVFILSLSSANVYAAGEININNEVNTFENVLRVENGHLYMPLRLAFTDHNLTENSLVKVNYNLDDKIIQVVCGPFDGYREDGSEIQGSTYQREIKICWSEQFPNGLLSMFKFDIVNGQPITNADYYATDFGELDEYGEPIFFKNLSAPIIIETVDENDGKRVLMAVEDIKKISTFFFGWNAYNVTVGDVQ